MSLYCIVLFKTIVTNTKSRRNIKYLFKNNDNKTPNAIKVARYSFSGSIPPKFEHKLRRYKQRFGKTATTALIDKDENFVMIRVAMTSEFS